MVASQDSEKIAKIPAKTPTSSTNHGDAAKVVSDLLHGARERQCALTWGSRCSEPANASLALRCCRCGRGGGWSCSADKGTATAPADLCCAGPRFRATGTSSSRLSSSAHNRSNSSGHSKLSREVLGRCSAVGGGRRERGKAPKNKLKTVFAGCPLQRERLRARAHAR